MSDGVIGSVAVSVVPSAEDFWRRFRAQTEGGATEAGRRAGQDWQRGFDESARSATVRVRADTSEARSQIAALNRDASSGHSGGLIGAAITLSPAIVPLAAAAAVAGAEFATLGATAVLAIKGIKTEMETGTPVGKQYSQVLDVLKTDLGQLSHTAADGVLTGFEQSVGNLQREMPQLNQLVGTQSKILGDVAAHLSGGVLGGFVTFAPLLDQIGASADRISARFEAWATGPGGTKFSQVLSSDYAKVAPLVDDIASALGHVVAASNGTGLLIVSDLGLLARVLDSFPTPVLTAIIDGFVAFRVVNSVTSLLSGVSGGFTLLAARATASATAINAANLSVAAEAATAAAEVATAQAAEAAAVATAQGEIAAALAGTGSVLAGSAAEAAAFAAEEAAAFQAAAVAAIASAEEIGAAAAAAAEESAAAAATASLSWSTMLGPVGIAVGAVALLGLSFLGTSHHTDEAKVSTQDYTAALIQTSGAINDVVRGDVAKKLSSSLSSDELKKAGLTLKDTVDIVTGVPAALAKYHSIDVDKLSNNLITTLYQQRHAFEDAASAARDQEASLAGVGSATDATKKQISDGNTALRGYIDALGLFNKSADTAADRGKLIGSVLVAVNGDALSFAGAMTSAAAADRALADGFVGDRQKIQDLRQQIEQLTNTTGPSATSNAVLAAQIDKTSTSIKTNKEHIAQLNSQIDSGKLSTNALASAHRALENAQASGKVSTANLANQQDKLSKALGGGTVNVAQLTKLQQELSAAYANSELAAINLNKGTIDYTKGGAPALVSQLQAIQTAAEGAASATYQHELRTKGAKQAADDAFEVYKNDTQGSLIDQAKQLGITARQAKKLADNYFGIKNSGDVKKKIELIGEDKVVDALKGILADLDILTGQTTVLDLAINRANANAAKNIGSGGKVLHQAAGGFISGEGSATSDSIPARLSNGEFVVNAAQTARHRRLLENLNNGVKGFSAGGFAGYGERLTSNDNSSVTIEQRIYNPVPEPASVSGPAGVRRAALALGR